MKENNICKNCGKILPPSNFEICDECRKNHNLSKFLKNLIDLGDGVSFDEDDFETMGIDEFDAADYIWDLSELHLITLHAGKYFINNELVEEFITKHYIGEDDCDKPNKIKIGDDYFDIYDPLRVKITKNPHYRRDILNLLGNGEFIEESHNIPFPQSDDLNRFIFIGETLLKTDLNKENIKQLNQIGNRIVNFYISTGYYFQIIEKYKNDNKIYFKLSDKGREIFELDDYNRNLNICKCILEHEILYKIFIDCLANNSISKDNIVDIMLQYDLNMKSMVTIKRRAQCISSWMHWIFNLMNGDESKQTTLF